MSTYVQTTNGGVWVNEDYVAVLSKLHSALSVGHQVLALTRVSEYENPKAITFLVAHIVAVWA